MFRTFWGGCARGFMEVFDGDRRLPVSLFSLLLDRRL